MIKKRSKYSLNIVLYLKPSTTLISLALVHYVYHIGSFITLLIRHFRVNVVYTRFRVNLYIKHFIN